uniref:Uncharacterized protein n=1 Tax=Sander lucioperca TaxID=283035 RepID=A0A8C9X439_SANLU
MLFRVLPVTLHTKAGQTGTPYSTLVVRPSVAKTRLISSPNVPDVSSEVTFDNIAVNCGSEVLSGLLVEVLAVDDPHLFEESRLAALASAEQQDLHQPFHVCFLPGETSVDLL